MDQLLVETLIARVLPFAVSLVLASRNFNRSVIILGMRSRPELCPLADKQNSFRCVNPGATALTVSSASIAMATSYLISALLLLDPVLRILLAMWGVILMASTLAYLRSYRGELFRVEEALERAGHKFLAGHLGLVVNLIVFVCNLCLIAVTTAATTTATTTTIATTITTTVTTTIATTTTAT
jgi:hypothetical protein